MARVVMIGEPQYCACPVPLSALLSMMSAPPDFTPTRRITKHILPMGDVYAPRKESIESAKKTRGDIARDKILAVMSNRWMPRSSISALVGMTPDETSRALGRKSIEQFVISKLTKYKFGHRYLWRLK